VLNLLKLPSLEAAPALLGWILQRQTPDGTLSVRIVETEAYHQDDPASHSFRGLTPRTAPMFEAGGTIYVHFTYGMHHAINIVTGAEGVGEAVLLRAAEPIEGIEIMKTYRNTLNIFNIASGPGKLAQALGIRDTSLSGQPLSKNSVQLLPSRTAIAAEEIVTSPRIGIRHATDLLWRFYLKDNPYISRYTSFKRGAQ